MSMGLTKSTHNAAVTLITHNATYHKALLETCVHAVNVYGTVQIVSRVEKRLSETNAKHVTDKNITFETDYLQVNTHAFIT